MAQQWLYARDLITVNSNLDGLIHAEMSANLAMSDHQFRAKAHGSADIRAQSSFHLPDLLIRAPSARTRRIFEEEHHGRPLHSP